MNVTSLCHVMFACRKYPFSLGCRGVVSLAPEYVSLNKGRNKGLQLLKNGSINISVENSLRSCFIIEDWKGLISSYLLVRIGRDRLTNWLTWNVLKRWIMEMILFILTYQVNFAKVKRDVPVKVSQHDIGPDTGATVDFTSSYGECQTQGYGYHPGSDQNFLKSIFSQILRPNSQIKR